MVATSGTTLSYQWRKNGVNISGANSSTYTLSSVKTTDAGTYSVKVTNAGGTVTSSGATLTVLVPPTITTQPQNQTATLGGSATFAVAASGTTPLTYQWYFNGTALSGANSSALTLTNVQVTNSCGDYSVRVANIAGSVTSTNAALTVNVPPGITSQPANQTVVVGQDASFSVVATGSPPPNYQWRFNGANLAGATSSVLTRDNAQTTNAGSYTVVVTNAAGSVTSAVATLTVNVPPGITTQPQNQTVATDQSASFSVVASGTVPLSYQWQFNGAPIPGATSSAYTVANAQITDAGVYSVSVWNVVGMAYSSNAILAVTGPPVGGSGDTACVRAINVSTCTWVHTVSGGDDRILIVGIALADTSDSVTSVTYGGTALTRITSIQSGNAAEMWSLLAPPVGTANIVATWTDKNNMAGWSGTFTNVDQTNPIRNSGVASGNSTAPSAAVASAVGDLVVDTLSANGDAVSLSVGGGQTQICQNTTGTKGGDCWGASSYEAGAASVTMSWSAGAAKNWGIAVAVLKAAPPIQADVTVSLTGPTTVPLRDNFPCAVSVANLGPQTASNIVVCAPLPAGIVFVDASGDGAISNDVVTWTIPSLACAATTNFTLTLRASTLGPLTNIVTATAGTSDPYPANNVSSLITTVANTAPVADNQSVSTPESAATPVTLTGSDANNDPLTFAIVTPPAQGVISAFNTATGTLIYTPNPGYTGTDSFTFRVNDGLTDSSLASVDITVTPIPPGIKSQPLSQTAGAGQSVTFAVAASGTAPLSYQWRRTDAELAGATSSLLTLASVRPTDAGSYTVVVANTRGSVTSAVAVLNVLMPPTATTVPASEVTNCSAVLNAVVDPQGLPTICRFEYGVTTTYGSVTPPVSLPAGAGATATSVAAPLAGLAPATLFHYRIVATNVAGTTFGQDVTFTTSVAPPLASTLAASEEAADSAVLSAVVCPQGATTTCFFQYGVTTNYGYLSATQQIAPGVACVTVETPVADLAPGTVYHYCIVANNVAGTTIGQDATFTTSIAPPSVLTLGASNVMTGSAVLNGTVDAMGAPTTCYFEYGVGTTYGSVSPAISVSASTTAAPVAVAAPIGGLAPGTPYHYRLVATNTAGTTTGLDATFTSLNLPALQLAGALTGSGGPMQLSLEAVPGATFSVLASASMELPLSNWTVIGEMTEVEPGRYQFTDTRPATSPQCFYCIRSR